MEQAFGVEPLFAGNVVQLTIFVGICLGYISTYVFRVANKVRRPAALVIAPHRRSPQRNTHPCDHLVLVGNACPHRERHMRP